MTYTIKNPSGIPVPVMLELAGSPDDCFTLMPGHIVDLEAVGKADYKIAMFTLMHHPELIVTKDNFATSPITEEAIINAK